MSVGAFWALGFGVAALIGVISLWIYTFDLRDRILHETRMNLHKEIERNNTFQVSVRRISDGDIRDLQKQVKFLTDIMFPLPPPPCKVSSSSTKSKYWWDEWNADLVKKYLREK